MSKRILVINAGSSSIKYKLFDIQSLERGVTLASGLIERIGESIGGIKHRLPGRDEIHLVQEIAHHDQGLILMLKLLTDPEIGVIASVDEIDVIGHRVVHGGEDFHEPTVLTSKVIEAIRKNIPLAPLHNPANLQGIEASMRAFPRAIQVGVFDTAFHQSMSPKAYRYALPKAWYEKYRVRRYGFHGTSHQYVAQEAAKYLSRDWSTFNALSFHLGNGASVTAIQGGKSVETSMGLTPLEGLVMGTRSGDLDPAILIFMARQLNLTLDELDRILNKESGLKGLCGENDFREILKRMAEGDRDAELGFKVYVHRIRHYLGAYMANVGGVHALIFTGGIGEHSAEIRAEVCRNLAFMGIVIDDSKNKEVHGGGISAIHAEESRVAVLVVPTDEEWAIAKFSYALIFGSID